MSKRKIIFIIISLVFFIVFFVMLSKDRNEEIVIVEDLPEEIIEPKYSVIGKSVEDRSIESYSFGDGEKHIALVGGIHGGYEWNSTYLAYKFIDYFTEDVSSIPADTTITIIPALNPDGLYKITGKDGRFELTDIPASPNDSGVGRFNANNVDLNRNFDCKWKPESTWRSAVVNAGSEAFSEPESKAFRDFVLVNDLNVVVFWHSQASAVYSSECESGPLQETLDILALYATASGYKPFTTFDSYEITGDAGDWLASINVPAISVELKTHDTIEWEGNLAGVKSILEYFSGR